MCSNWLISTKTFRSGSNKCLYSEAGTAALTNKFQIGTGDSMPCRGKILGANMFSIWLDNSFIELPESNLKIWEKQGII